MNQQLQSTKAQEQNRSIKGRIYFFIAMIILYVPFFIITPHKTQQALLIAGKLILAIIPVLIFVIILMAVIDYFIKPQKIKKYLGEESGVKGWLIAITFGIISHGSIYAWYPLLKEMRDHGMREGLVAAFIYNRAIKIPFIPLMIYYFGLKFFIILTLYMIIASVIEGLLIEKI